MIEEIKQIIDEAHRIVVIQADNPDADSLGSALALEAILSEYGKEVSLFCAVQIPEYLKYLPGWSRVVTDLPQQFDISIIVDASTKTLFEKMTEKGETKWLALKPSIVFDHHGETANDLDFATIIINDSEVSSTSELIYSTCKDMGLIIPSDAHDPIMTGILGDTQGLTNQLTSASTYTVMSELVRAGANRPALEELRRSASKMALSIYRFKGSLIGKTEFSDSQEVATVTLNQEEINTYSPLYNPGPLIQGDLLQVENVRVGIVFKVYDDGKITAMIRCNNSAKIADKIAVQFGGGGHSYAAGFKITDGRAFSDVKTECIVLTLELLSNLEGEDNASI